MADGQIKVNGKQRKLVGAWTKVNGTWRTISAVYPKVGGRWRESWKNNFHAPSGISYPSKIVRGSVITLETQFVDGAHYEFQVRYYSGSSWGNWGGSVVYPNHVNNQFTVSSNINNTKIQFRVRSVAPVTHDKASSWITGPERSLTPATLPDPAGLTYPTSITRGQKIKISWNVDDTGKTYTLIVRYRRGTNSSPGTVFSGTVSETGTHSVDYTVFADTYWDTIEFEIYANKTGYYQSGTVTGPKRTLGNQTLASPSTINAPKPYRGQTITISWSAVSNASSYQLEVQYDSGSWSNIYTGVNRSYSYKVSTGNNSKIRFRVKATASRYNDSAWKYSTQTNIDLPPLKTQTWTATRTKSWRPNFNGQWMPMNDYVYQGQWYEDGVTWGNYTGMAFFDHNNIRSTLAGKTIEKVRIYFYRINAGGYASGQAINLYTHNYSSPPSDASKRPTMSHVQGPFSSFARGEGKWITVSNTVAERFKDGTAKGIGLYRSDGKGYLYMSENVKIEISYR